MRVLEILVVAEFREDESGVKFVGTKCVKHFHLSFHDNKVLKVQLIMLKFVQVCRTID
jgi:hypothetical protein